MKNLTILTALVFIFLCSCAEERPGQAEVPIGDIVDKIHQGFFEFEVHGGTKEEAIYLDNDGMDGIYGIRMSELDQIEGNDMTLFLCINSLSPGLVQQLRLRDITNDFAVCRYSIGISYQQDTEDLMDEVELERLEIIRNFEEGNVTENSLEEELEQMREGFLDAYVLIKEFYSEYFRTCLDTMLREVNGLFNAGQWQSLVNCLES